MPLLLRTRARHLPRSARQLLHPASSHAASARISVLFRAPQPARARPALRRHPHNGIPISIGARFSSINPIRPGPGHAANGQRSLFTGPTRIDSFSLKTACGLRGHHMITAPDLSAFLQPAGDDHLAVRCATLEPCAAFAGNPPRSTCRFAAAPPTPHDSISTTPSVRLHHALLRAAVPLCCAPVRVTCRDLPANCSTLLHRTLPAPGSPFSSVPHSLPGHAQHSAATPTTAFQSP